MVVAFEEFLEWPLAKVRPLAPETVIYAASGTRRSAVLAGISLDGDNYARWTHAQMINSCDIIFDHGTRNVITRPRKGYLCKTANNSVKRTGATNI